MRPTITREMVEKFIAEEYRKEPVLEPPLDPVLMAWPFKTDEERAALGKWFARESKAIKDQQRKKLGTALV